MIESGPLVSHCHKDTSPIVSIFMASFCLHYFTSLKVQSPKTVAELLHMDLGDIIEPPTLETPLGTMGKCSGTRHLASSCFLPFNLFHAVL